MGGEFVKINKEKSFNFCLHVRRYSLEGIILSCSGVKSDIHRIKHYMPFKSLDTVCNCYI